MRILWIKTSPLHPLTRGGDLRTFHMLKGLKKEHHVTFVGLVADGSQVDAARLSGEYSHRSYWTRSTKASLKLSRLRFYWGAACNALLESLPYAVDRFSSTKWRRQIAGLLRSGDFDIVVCDFLFPAASLPWELRQASPRPRWILFEHNVETLIWRRRAAASSSIAKRYWQAQALRMERFEQGIAAQFDGVIAVSETDSNVLRNEFGLLNILGHIATGVDAKYFAEPVSIPSENPTIVFLGSMDWHANIDGVLQFVDTCWSKVRLHWTSARLLIVGRDPTPEIVELGSREDGIEITGTVPDVRPYLKTAHVCIVPLRIGGGTRIKIFEAMASGIPVVSTNIGAEGLPVHHGEDVLLSADIEGMADLVIDLLGNADLARSLVTAALHNLVMPNSWDTVSAQFSTLLTSTLTYFEEPKNSISHA